MAAGFILAALNRSTYATGSEPVSAGSGWVGKNDGPRHFACCGRAWDKARLGAPGLGG